MTGKTLAHFRILEKIAEGGMGVVYRALDTNLGRTVAIKVIHPEALGNAERKQRFVQEARTASALNHSNIVTIHEIASEGDVDFIAMEYVDGQSLDHLAGARPLEIDQAIDFGIQIARKGWLEKVNVLNTRDANDVLKFARARREPASRKAKHGA